MKNLLAEREKMTAEVADLESQKAALQAQLDEDAGVNADQIAQIKDLTVSSSCATEFCALPCAPLPP